jgi:tetratricopeptide (TPR) repeat protein
VWRISIIVLLGVVLLWLSFALTTSLVLGRHQSAYTLRLWPTGAEAAARRSGDLLASPAPTQTDISAARQLAVTALGKEPANAAAARDLGLMYTLQGKANEAARAFAYSERMSRRDIPTQLWLIESKVQAGDVAGALKHYDRAMRTSLEIREMLLPTLVGAAQDPVVAASLKKIVAARPNWWAQFTDVLVGQSQGAAAIGNIVPALHLDPANPDQARQLSVGLRHMVDLGAIPQAFTLYRQVRRFSGSVPLLRGGDFEAVGQLAPFEWQLTDGEERQGVREARDGAQGRFALSLYGDSAGEVARQLMSLPPGKYRLSGQAGSVSKTAPQPSIAVVCAKDASVLANVALPRGARASFERTFQVSAQCPAQYVFISIAGSLDRQAEAPWIDSLDVRPDRGA